MRSHEYAALHNVVSHPVLSNYASTGPPSVTYERGFPDPRPHNEYASTAAFGSNSNLGSRSNYDNTNVPLN